MRRHPRLRRWAKWSGLAFSVALLLVFAASCLWAFDCFFPPHVFCIKYGDVVLTLNSRWSTRPGWIVFWAPTFPPEHLLPRSGVVNGSRVVWLPLWIPLLFAAATTAFLWRDRRRVPPGHCRCGYDLTGNTSGVCPECGTRVQL